MPEFNLTKIKKYLDPRNGVWYGVVIILLAITWSGVKAVQTNYGLQKQIARLQQENQVLALQNQNIALNNQYLASSQYEDLAARQNLGLAAPGETVLLIPQNVALKYIDPNISPTQTATYIPSKQPPKVIKNLEAWRDFLLGRAILSD